MKERLLVLIGPSGSGKSTLARELHQAGVVEVMPTWTTRPARDDEQNGSLEHRFVSKEEFERLENEKFFVGIAEMFSYSYGVPLPTFTKTPCLILRASLVEKVSKLGFVAVVYQLEACVETLQSRQWARGELTRLWGIEEELSQGRNRAHRIIDTDSGIEKALNEIQSYIKRDFRKEKVGLAEAERIGGLLWTP